MSEISVRCSAMFSVLRIDSASPALLPCSGQIAPKRPADLASLAFGSFADPSEPLREERQDEGLSTAVSQNAFARPAPPLSE